MEFASVRDLRINTGEIWKTLEREKELIITSNGRPVALMAGITGASLEMILNAVRKGRGEWAVREMRESAVEKGMSGMDVKEIDREIRKTRKERRR